MIRYDEDKENEKNDFFEDSEVPEKPVEPKKPVLTPDDPRYWEEPEDEFEHLRPSRDSCKLWAWVVAVAVVVGLLWAGYIRMFHPYVREAVQYGYVEQVAPQGDVISASSGAPSFAPTTATAANSCTPSLTALNRAVRSAQLVGVNVAHSMLQPV